MKTKREKQSEALERLLPTIAYWESYLKRCEDKEDQELIKAAKTKLINLNRDAANLRKKLGYD